MGDAPVRAPDLRPGGECHPGTLLCLLAFAYAKEVFSSEEIVRACYSDEMFALICHGEIPFVEELRTFRRRNRCRLEPILAAVFVRAMDQCPLSAGLEQDLRHQAAERLQTAWLVDDCDD